MYRDDTCAVCGESLPPDHFYCREHAAEVDDRLHEIGALLGDLAERVPRLARLLDEVAGETWDWLADEEEASREAEAGEPEAGDTGTGETGDELVWPPTAPLRLRVHADEVDVDVDSEPGLVRLDVACELGTLLEALARGLDEAQVTRLARACARAKGGNVTH